MQRDAEPIGVVLAGGRGSRIGGSKAVVELCGRPLISYPLAAMKDALSEVVILAKADTPLPSPAGAPVWTEAARRHHPLLGIVEALRLAEGRPVLVCAADLPLLTSELIDRIAKEEPAGAPAVVCSCLGATQPLLGCYQPQALDLLREAALAAQGPLREVVSEIQPRVLEVEDSDSLFNVNLRPDLLTAAALLKSRRATRR